MTAAAMGSWWERAACQRADPELFFPISGSGSAVTDVARAKAICARCAVRQNCLDYAVGTGQVHGVWGGASEEERRALVASWRRVPEHDRRRDQLGGRRCRRAS
jgi:WhiB family transcriptional regulator, redox-sensing transcriptional regulator